MKKVAIMAGVIVAMGVQSATANLLSDPSFETAGVPDWTISDADDISREDWANGAPGNGGTPPVYGLVGDGQFGLAATPWKDNDSGNGSFSQTVAGTAGVAYTFSITTHTGNRFFNFGDNPSNFGAVDVRHFMDFLDGASVVLSFVEIIQDQSNSTRGSNPPPGAEASADWQTWVLNGTAPAGTASVRVGSGFRGGKDAFADEGSFRWDNASLVPEPGSLMLMGLGSLLIASRRRRNG